MHTVLLCTTRSVNYALCITLYYRESVNSEKIIDSNRCDAANLFLDFI